MQEHRQAFVRRTDSYDPFVRGSLSVGVRTIQAFDAARSRLFPCEVWYPAAACHSGQDITPATQDLFTTAGTARRQAAARNAAVRTGVYPLIVFSHHSGGDRRAATFLCTHLSSHGYVVAALDHSELVAPELARKDGETVAQKTARAQAWIANRVPDLCFLVDFLLDSGSFDAEIRLDATRIGIVGHSFGGWTALATPDVEQRIKAIVALAPGGNSRPRPGILPAELHFAWQREISTLFLVAENDTPLPLAGMYELFERTPSAKKLMVVLRRADHCHFLDDVEQQHEALRAMPIAAELGWLEEMLPIAKLCSGPQAHLFVRGLTLCQMDAILKQDEKARQFLAGDLETELAVRQVEAFVHSATEAVQS